MSGQRRWIKVWARTVGMPVGATDEDKSEFLPIKQSDVAKALAFRTFWIVLHVVTCLMIVAGNGRSLGWWQCGYESPAVETDPSNGNQNPRRGQRAKPLVMLLNPVGRTTGVITLAERQ